MKRGIVLKSIELSLESNFTPNRGIVDYECNIALRVLPEVCTKCNYPYIPTEKNKICLMCTRNIDRIRLEKMQLLMSIIY